MGIWNFLKKKSISNTENIGNEERTRKVRFEYPIAEYQKQFVIAEVEKMNVLLKTLDCTKKLYLDSDKLTADSIFCFEPFTIKTMKISKYPCILRACSTMYLGYGVSIYYDINDDIGKGHLYVATQRCSYTIDFKNSSGILKITKVITTDDKGNTKLYHEQKDGTIIR